jgi:glyoxylase-like metal-dependent hydrolase (beta-lactamase superfamily II)
MNKLIRKTYPLSGLSLKDWNEVFAKPQDITCETIQTGKLVIHNKFMLNFDNPEAGNVKKGVVKVPVYCNLVHHEREGYFLVDAGLDRSYQTNPYGSIKGVLKKFLWPVKSYQNKGEDIASLLAERKINVKGVFFSHMHADHISGVRDLHKDIKLFVDKDESDYTLGPLFNHNVLDGFTTLYTFDFLAAQEMAPLGLCIDVFGDGSFWAIRTSGHRKGHVSYLVNGKNGTFLLTGDACDLKIGFEKGIGPGFGSYNKKDAQQSLNRIIAFSCRYPQVTVIFSHEEGVRAEPYGVESN